jgi:hypothetical protein
MNPQVDVLDALAGELIFNAGRGHEVKVRSEKREIK